MNAAVFLDRDNTIIHNDGDLGDPKLVKLIQGAASAIASLRGLGFKVIVVTNQGGVARGKYTEADVEATHQRINELILANSGATVDRFYFCPYHPQAIVEQYRAEHPWRKPQPGMLIQAAKDFNLDLSQSWMIGDQVRDIQAGIVAGARPILLRASERGETIATTEPAVPEPYFVAANLIEAVKIVAQKRRPMIPAEMFVEGQSGRIRAPLNAPTAPIVAARTVAVVAEPVVRSMRQPEPSPSQSLVQPQSPPPASPSRQPEQIRPVAAPLGPIAPSAPAEHPRPHIAPTPAEAPAPSPAPAPAPMTPAAREHASHAPSHQDNELLLQILQELRNQRQTSHEFSALSMMAIVLQLLVVVCLLGGLWLGGKDASVFARFLSVGALLQLMVIALQSFRR
jgi:D-glycero-D-manno-heptose 1,7-bisphosphate phosphatase